MTTFEGLIKSSNSNPVSCNISAFNCLINSCSSWKALSSGVGVGGELLLTAVWEEDSTVIEGFIIGLNDLETREREDGTLKGVIR